MTEQHVNIICLDKVQSIQLTKFAKGRWAAKLSYLLTHLLQVKKQRLVFKADQSSNRKNKYCLKNENTITMKVNTRTKENFF